MVLKNKKAKNGLYPCWIARESRLGWTLTYDYGLGKRSLGCYFGSAKDIKRALACNILFVWTKKGSKEKEFLWKI